MLSWYNTPMGKMFLTVPQAAKRVGCTEQQILQWFADGQLQEFKDHNTSMAKTEQVALLAGEWREKQFLSGEKSLLELSQDKEDTSLGANLMESVYSPDTTKKDRQGATSYYDPSRGDRLPPMNISDKGSPIPFIVFIVSVVAVIITLGAIVYVKMSETDALKKSKSARTVENTVVSPPVSSTVKYKISILLGDKVYKTIVVSKRVEFINGGVSWIEDNGNMGYCSGQYLVETVEGY